MVPKENSFSNFISWSLAIIFLQIICPTVSTADDTGSIAGIVYHSDGVSPVSGVELFIDAVQGDPCSGGNVLKYDIIDASDGTFTINGLPPGNYYLHAKTEVAPFYLAEWWTGGSPEPSSYDCSQAQLTTVVANQITDGIEFRVDPPSTVSGTIYKDDGIIPITGTELDIEIFQGSCQQANQVVGAGSIILDNGTYTVGGLLPGNYYMRTSNNGQANYLNEWWAEPESTMLCQNAQSFSVVSGENVTGKNFQLDTASTISGTIYQKDGSTPVTDADVYILVFQENPCTGLHIMNQAHCNSTDGTFLIQGLSPGVYFVKTDPYPKYIGEWWTGDSQDPSSYDCNIAEHIVISSPGQNISDINFQIDPGGKISGTVYQSDGTTPVTDSAIEVKVVKGDPCGSWLEVESVRSRVADGAFVIESLSPGLYYLMTENEDIPHNHTYINEWWNSQGSTHTCGEAQRLIVHSTTQEITGINFQLKIGGTITGTIRNTAGSPIEETTPGIRAFQDNSCDAAGEIYKGKLDTTYGRYEFKGLPPGNYFLQTNNGGYQNYINEWWTGDSIDPSDKNCSLAQSILISSSAEIVTGLDFRLDSGAAISGEVFESDGTTPLVAGDVYVDIYQQNACDEPPALSGIRVDSSNGNFSVKGLLPGDYYLKCRTDGTDHIPEWWRESAGTHKCDEAQKITVSGTEMITDKNFQMDWGGTLSGKVFQSDGSTPLIYERIDIHLYKGNPCGDMQLVMQEAIDISTGQFEISGLSPGDYYLRTDNRNLTNFVNEWWSSSESSYSCENAQIITILSAGHGVEGLNFQLGPGVSISGTVFKEDGVTPVTDALIQVGLIRDGDRCNRYGHKTASKVDTFTGHFSFTGLLPFYYFAGTNNLNQTNYVNEWFAGNASTNFCGDAEMIWLDHANESRDEINFQLDKGGYISGSVCQGDGETPVANIGINAYTSQSCSVGSFDGNWVGGTFTGINGKYTIHGLPSGDNYVSSCSTCGGLYNYVDEWWDSNTGTVNCNAAEPVMVSQQQVTDKIDFLLDNGGTLTGHILDKNSQPFAKPISVYVQPSDSSWSGYFSWSSVSGGSFTIYGVKEDAYKLSANNNQDSYIETKFYPNSLTWEQAEEIPVTAGNVTTLMNMLLDVDSDRDHLMDNLELAGCTNPYDADTDEDGIIDGHEDENWNGQKDLTETDPCNIDTDGDGIQDGTELSLTEFGLSPDTDTDIYQPDLDPLTGTDPLDPDSDNDAILDGEEDSNLNGRVDTGETDPNEIDVIISATVCENWETGTIDEKSWQPVGSPASIISPNGRNGGFAINVNGDNQCESGLYSRHVYSTTGQLSAEFALKGYTSGSATAMGIKAGFTSDLHDGTFCNPTTEPPGYYNELAYIYLDPQEGRQKVYYGTYDGQFFEEPFPDDNWHFYKIKIDSNGLVSYFRDSVHIYTTPDPIDPSAFPNTRFQIKGRAYYGEMLADDICVSVSSEVTNTTYNVDDDYGNPYPGSGTATDPFHEIQMGIDAASSGNTVNVAAGIYYENIAMKNGVVIQGEGQNITTIDGSSNGSVVTAVEVDSNTKIDGFTITNGVAPTGGGMYIFNASLAVSNCVFLENRATMDDSAGGGGMAIIQSSPTVNNCAFLGNRSYVITSFGGGICNWDSSPIITNCIFSGNLSNIGGGIANFGNSAPILTNCVFYKNRADYGAGGINNVYGDHPLIMTNCIAWADIPSGISGLRSVSYSNIQSSSGVYDGIGNLNDDPMFVDPDGLDDIAGNRDDDFHLQPGSACIDSGNNNAPALPITDFDGDDRKIDDPNAPDVGNGTAPIVDMGVDEFDVVSTCKGDFDTDGDVDDSDLGVFVAEFGRAYCSDRVLTLDNVVVGACGDPWFESGVTLSLVPGTEEDCSAGCVFGTQVDGVWLSPTRLNLDLGSLAGYVYSAEVDITDACGPGCTAAFLYDDALTVDQASNSQSGSDTLVLSGDGASVDKLAISSCEGFVEEIRVRVFPCEGDIDNDGDVDGSDFEFFTSEFGRYDCN